MLSLLALPFFAWRCVIEGWWFDAFVWCLSSLWSVHMGSPWPPQRVSTSMVIMNLFGHCLRFEFVGVQVDETGLWIDGIETADSTEIPRQ